MPDMEGSQVCIFNSISLSLVRVIINFANMYNWKGHRHCCTTTPCPEKRSH